MKKLIKKPATPKQKQSVRAEVLKKLFDKYNQDQPNLEAMAALDAVHPNKAEVTAWSEIECLELLAGRTFTTREILMCAAFHTDVAFKMKEIVQVREAEARPQLRLIK